ncbi:permease prefix domain 1-containing protein [Niallia sp. RD1]|uniref:permease prefix domain 1-containing protein n=1 Tax=Niallia sp. RD1 TaxID=2962858 RepID=UPI0020C1A513|nr:permease prefix domain 1-containing protein [Niallia sp. RD1]UTI42765.1 permease prefix domain 1-containing protein [Niallia sp. RD1]
MNSIINYLDNVFASLPKTSEMEKLKQEMLSNMEDKYYELKEEGKTENEAIGIVISEFGNIDELLSELDLPLNEEKPQVPQLSEEEVDTFFQQTSKAMKSIGIGVMLCLLGSSLLVFFIQLFEQGFLTGITENTATLIGVAQLLLFIAFAVSLFIYSGQLLEKYKYIEKGTNFKLPIHLKKKIQMEKETYQPIFFRSLIIGVALCILSPIALLVTIAINDQAANYGVCILLVLIAIAVYLFIVSGGKKDAYDKLLKEASHSFEKKHEDKVIGAFAAIIWPLAVAIFLITGFVYGNWHINWIIFPISGLLMAMFSGTYSILKKEG